jgi:hypothetical protein
MSRQDDAEQIRAYLVQLRGGGPFLSSYDGRLLLRWMDLEVPVPVVLQALDRASEKRRRRRVKSPLSLRNAETAVKKALAGGLELPEARGPEPLRGLIDRLREAGGVEAEVAEELAGLDQLQSAMGVLARGLERAWEQADRAQLQAEAAKELFLLEESCSESEFQRACDEVARDLLRQRHPLLCASAAWDTVGR